MERFVYGEEDFAISICTKDWKLTFRSKNNPSMTYLLLCKLVQRYSDNFQDFRDEVNNLICGKEAFIVFRGKFQKYFLKNWYFATKIVLTYCEKKMIEKNF